jgi:hypothetical protein
MAGRTAVLEQAGSRATMEWAVGPLLDHPPVLHKAE